MHRIFRLNDVSCDAIRFNNNIIIRSVARVAVALRLPDGNDTRVAVALRLPEGTAVMRVALHCIYLLHL